MHYRQQPTERHDLPKPRIKAGHKKTNHTKNALVKKKPLERESSADYDPQPLRATQRTGELSWSIQTDMKTYTYL